MPLATPDQRQLIAGADLSRALDAVFVNAPLRNYAIRPGSMTSPCLLWVWLT
jgi:hypothetical protein